MYCYRCSPTITHNTFTANWADIGGGGVFCDTADVTVMENAFVADSAGWYGGAIRCELSNAVISGNTFSSNWAWWAYGGAIDIHGYFPTVSGNVFTANTAVAGGALSCSGVYTPSNPTIVNNVFIGNSASDGGALFCTTTRATVTWNVFISNRANQGGAMVFGTDARPVISHCLFISNSATYCGYGDAIYANSGTGRIENCTFTQNWSDNNHGGALAGLEEGNFIVKNSILWRDSARIEVEIYVDASSRADITYSDVTGRWGGETLPLIRSLSLLRTVCSYAGDHPALMRAIRHRRGIRTVLGRIWGLSTTTRALVPGGEPGRSACPGGGTSAGVCLTADSHPGGTYLDVCIGPHARNRVTSIPENVLTVHQR